jgi:hypothetical protein
VKVCIYTSIGDNIDKFIEYYQQLRMIGIDLYLNFYGEDDIKFNTITCYSKWNSRIKTAKFPSLKNCYSNSDISEYDFIYVWDDDFIIKDFLKCLDLISNIPKLMIKNNLDILSPSHSPDGRISHKIMKTVSGNHTVRITNFIELGYPIFSKIALKKYMSEYDGQLSGWGNDWWFLNVLESNNKMNCGIYDSISFFNPHHYQKKTGLINDLISQQSRKEQWEKTKKTHNLFEWMPNTFKYI